MKQLLILTLAILTITPSQAQTFDWTVPFSGDNYSQGLGIAADPDGNVLTTGVFWGTVDFDPSAATATLTSTSEEIFITKQDPNGNLIWAKQIGSIGGDIAWGITSDNTGNIYVTGHFQGTVDFDPGVTENFVTGAGAQDIFILKLNADGEFIWVKTIGGSDFEKAFKIKVDASNNIYICGSVNNGTVDFDPGAGTSFLTSFFDTYLLKLNAAGDFVWVKQFTNASDIVVINDFDFDASGNIYTTGRFLGTANFNTSGGTTNLTSAGGNDVFIAKLNATGDLQWTKQMGGTGHDVSNGIDVSASGDLILTGYFSTAADFDPDAGVETLTSIGDRDIFVCKLNSSGAFSWAKGVGGSGLDQAETIRANVAGDIFVAGTFSSTADFDPGAGTANLTAFGANDAVLFKLNSSGTFQSVLQFGGSETDWLQALAIDADQNVLFAGWFQGTADLDPTAVTSNYTTVGATDAFVGRLELDDVSIDSKIQQEHFSIYPNPASETVQITNVSNLEEIRIYNLSGSLVQIEKTSIFSVAQLNPGVYLIVVRTSSDQWQTQFVKR